jgi:hypothetical protein
VCVGEPGAARAGQHQRAACFMLAPGGDGVDEVRAVERGKFIEAGRVHRRVGCVVVPRSLSAGPRSVMLLWGPRAALHVVVKRASADDAFGHEGIVWDAGLGVAGTADFGQG